LRARRPISANPSRRCTGKRKSSGLDPKALRAVIALRKRDAGERDAHAALVQSYLEALGDLIGIPLGDHAVARAAGGLAPPV
jgi:hypothetical protein